MGAETRGNREVSLKSLMDIDLDNDYCRDLELDQVAGTWR